MMKQTSIAALLLAAACSGGNEAPAAPEAGPPSAETAATEVVPETVSALALYKLDCGRIDISDLDGFSSSGDYAGQSDTFGDGCFLVRHPEGDLIWDLGLPTALASSPPQENGVFTVSLDFTLSDQLLELGLTPGDIEYVSISHSHFDHTGQADQFPTSTWLVHADEHAAMFPPAPAEDTSADAPENDTDTPPPFVDFASLEADIFEGEKDVFGDGSVTIIPAPGHTPGHTVLRINLPEAGTLLLTGDLYHRKESRELQRVPRFNFDEAQTRVTMAAFEALAAETGARVIIQHNLEDLASLPDAPEALR